MTARSVDAGQWAELQGLSAAHLGRAAADCPYETLGVELRAWVTGWLRGSVSRASVSNKPPVSANSTVLHVEQPAAPRRDGADWLPVEHEVIDQARRRAHPLTYPVIGRACSNAPRAACVSRRTAAGSPRAAARPPLRPPSATVPHALLPRLPGR